MSGRGEFKLSEIQHIIEDFCKQLEMQGKEDPECQGYFYEVFTPDVEQIFKSAIAKLEEAYDYARAVDYYLAGDYSEKSLIEKVREIQNERAQ